VGEKMQQKIGHKIKQRRKELGYTLKELAGDRITPAQISAIENNKCKPSTSLLEYLCDRLDVDSEYFTLSNDDKLRAEFCEIQIKCQELMDSGNPKQASIEVEKALSLFKALDDEQKGYYYFIKGAAAYDLEHFMESFDLYVKSIAHYIKTSNVNRIADLYVKIGNSLILTGKPDMGLGYYMNAYNFIDRQIENDIAIKIMFNLAICYSQLERPKLCKKYVEECRAFISNHECSKKDSYIPGLDMLNGIILNDQKEMDVSLEVFKEAYEKYKKENDFIGMGRAQYNLAMTYWDTSNYQEAVEFLKKAIDIKNQNGDKDIVDAYVNLSKIYKEMNLLDNAIETIRIAEERVLKDDSPKGIVDVFTAKFELLCDIGDYDKAEVFAYLALDTIQKNGMQKLESNMYVKLSEMYKKMGDEKSSIDNLLKANEITMKGNFGKL
jgi:HTH-type transcriptional regulator, quorum sensing regulator NprR